MNVDLTQFHEIEFPSHCDIVYVLEYIKSGDTSAIPFYVGETSRHMGRFGDYVSAKFSASTDFKVGEAVRYLRACGYKVMIKYKESNSRRADEESILKTLVQEGHRLLNSLAGYDYRNSDEERERLRIRGFIDELIRITDSAE
ncbi:MAG: hypothetical protein ABSH41_09750 [Syntrophobacteraceae bacterium]|jgi:hypothetical protein